jgi:hypothetical protein
MDGDRRCFPSSWDGFSNRPLRKTDGLKIRPTERDAARPEETLVEKIKIDSALFERAKRAAAAQGYSSVEEFVQHCIENELKKIESDNAEGQVADQLRGLGYIE